MTMEKEYSQASNYHTIGSLPEGNARINAAEMMAYWRSSLPAYSRDRLSAKLASPDSIKKSFKFQNDYNYPLVPRKISVRAGYIFQQATRLLMTGHYDGCISLSSGFSLLTYYIAKAVKQLLPQLAIIDVDLPTIIEKRQQRLKAMEGSLDQSLIERITLQAVDLEQTCRDQACLRERFSQCRSPIFILEGSSYYLSLSCLKWIVDQVAGYTTSAIIFDYFPADSDRLSSCFARIFTKVNPVFPGLVKHVAIDRNHWLKPFAYVSDRSIQAIENEMASALGQAPKFKDPNDFLPVRIITATKN